MISAAASAIFLVLIPILIEMVRKKYRRWRANREFEKFLQTTWAVEWEEGKHGKDN